MCKSGYADKWNTTLSSLQCTISPMGRAMKPICTGFVYTDLFPPKLGKAERCPHADCVGGKDLDTGATVPRHKSEPLPRYLVIPTMNFVKAKSNGEVLFYFKLGETRCMGLMT